MRPWARRRDRPHDLPLGLAVEVGGRLVEQQQRRVAQERAGQRDPLALPRGQPGAAVAEHRVQAVGQLAHGVCQAGRGDRRPDLIGRCVGATEAHVLGDRRVEQMRSLGHPRQARSARRRGRARRGRRRRRGQTQARARRARAARSAGSTCRSRWDRPAPAPRPRSTVSERSSSAGSRAAGVADAQPLDGEARERGVGEVGARAREAPRALPARRTPAPRRPCPRRSRGSWRRAGAAAGRPRGQAPARTAPVRRPRWPFISRRPIATATSATEIVATSSRISEERKVIRSVADRGPAVAFGDLADRLPPGPWPDRRPSAWAARRRRRGSGRPSRSRIRNWLVHAFLRRGADERHEQRDQRDRDGDDRRRDPVVPEHDHEHDDRHDHGEEQLRQVQREVAVERVDPAGGEDRQLAGALLARSCPGRASRRAAAARRVAATSLGPRSDSPPARPPTPPLHGPGRPAAERSAGSAVAPGSCRRGTRARRRPPAATLARRSAAR